MGRAHLEGMQLLRPRRCPHGACGFRHHQEPRIRSQAAQTLRHLLVEGDCVESESSPRYSHDVEPMASEPSPSSCIHLNSGHDYQANVGRFLYYAFNLHRNKQGTGARLGIELKHGRLERPGCPSVQLQLSILRPVCLAIWAGTHHLHTLSYKDPLVGVKALQERQQPTQMRHSCSSVTVMRQGRLTNSSIYT